MQLEFDKLRLVIDQQSKDIIKLNKNIVPIENDNLSMTEKIIDLSRKIQIFEVFLNCVIIYISKVVSFQVANLDIASKAKQLNDKSVREQIRISTIETIQDKLKFAEFIWEIDNFSVKRKRAENGNETEIFSDPFYSHRNGYKMCLSALPDGYDHDGKGVYLEVCFHIMRGPFDNILKWPFKYSVTLALIDQQTGLDHCNDTYKYDDLVKDDDWNKPTTEMNGSIGTYKFINLNDMLNTTALSERDQVFIRCTVSNQ